MTTPSTAPVIHQDVHTVDQAIDLFLNQLSLEQAKELAANHTLHGQLGKSRGR